VILYRPWVERLIERALLVVIALILLAVGFHGGLFACRSGLAELRAGVTLIGRMVSSARCVRITPDDSTRRRGP